MRTDHECKKCGSIMTKRKKCPQCGGKVNKIKPKLIGIDVVANFAPQIHCSATPAEFRINECETTEEPETEERFSFTRGVSRIWRDVWEFPINVYTRIKRYLRKQFMEPAYYPITYGKSYAWRFDYKKGKFVKVK